MSRYWGERYVPVAERRAKAAQRAAKLKRRGRALEPLEIDKRGLAYTYWAKAWSDNLERYSDYANRVPRGRSYARNGSVIDLQIEEGLIKSQVYGRRLYKIKITIDPIPEARWSKLRQACAGRVGSLVELLDGKISDEVMEIVAEPGEGLFPAPREIDLSCSCPDWAEMCKHVAATLYGVGARFNEAPELLFLLRGVSPQEMIEEAIGGGLGRLKQRAGRRVLEVSELASVFGVEIDLSEEAPPPPPALRPAMTKPKPKPKAAKPKPKPKAKPKAPIKAKASAQAMPAEQPVDGLSEPLRDTLLLIQARPGLRVVALARELDLSLAVMVSSLNELRSCGRIRFVGTPSQGGYYLAN